MLLWRFFPILRKKMGQRVLILMLQNQMSSKGETQGSLKGKYVVNLDVTPFSLKIKTNSPIKQYRSQLSDSLDISQSLSSSKPLKNPVSMMKLIRVDKYVKIFVNKLLAKAYIYSRIESTDMAQYLEENYTQFSKSKQQKTKFRKLLNCSSVPVFDPSSVIILFWDLITAGLWMLVLWIIPYLWSFQELGDLSLEKVGSYTLLFMVLTILIQLNTAFIEQGNLIDDHGRIMQHYFKTDFCIDLLFLITLNFVAYFGSETFLWIIPNIILIAKKLLDKLQQMNEIMPLTPFWREILNLIRLIVLINYFAHMIACLWHYVGQATIKDQKNTWILQGELLHESNLIRYCHSYYFATVTMVTVGYGDVFPTNVSEMLVCIAIMFIACGFFAFFLSRIGEIVTNINNAQAAVNTNLRIINKYMKNCEIPQQLQNRIRNYLGYIAQEQDKEESEKLEEIIQSLSGNLKSELMSTAFKTLVQNNKFLCQNLTEQTIIALSRSMKSFHYCPNDIIFRQGESDDCSLYLVQYGQVKLRDEKFGFDMCTLQKGDSFGEICFLTGQQRRSTAISIGFTKLYKIERQEFMKILTQPEWEHFHQMSQEMIYSPSTKCFCCKKVGHYIAECPIVNYKPDVGRLILQFNLAKQDRRGLKRRERPKWQTFKKLQALRGIQQKFVEQDSIYTSESESSSSLQAITEKARGSNERVSNQFLEPEPQENSLFQSNQRVPSIKEIVSPLKLGRKPSQQNQSNGGQVLQTPQMATQAGHRDSKNLIKQDSSNPNFLSSPFQVSLQSIMCNDLDRLKEYANYFRGYNVSTLVLLYNRRRRPNSSRTPNAPSSMQSRISIPNTLKALVTRRLF